MTTTERDIDKQAERIVAQDVRFCQSALVELLLQKGIEGFSIEDIENLDLYTVEDASGFEDSFSNSQLLEEIERVEMEADECEDDERKTRLDEYLERLREAEPEVREIYEWWLVTEWLAKKLREQGHPILDNDYGTWWGRPTTGQMISMDHVIKQIAKELIC